MIIPRILLEEYIYINLEVCQFEDVVELVLANASLAGLVLSNGNRSKIPN